LFSGFLTKGNLGENTKNNVDGDQYEKQKKEIRLTNPHYKFCGKFQIISNSKLLTRKKKVCDGSEGGGKIWGLLWVPNTEKGKKRAKKKGTKNKEKDDPGGLRWASAVTPRGNKKNMHVKAH